LGRYVPECPHGSVLITARNKQVGLGLTRGHPPIEVNKMTDPEAQELLCSLLGDDDISPTDDILLASRLEYLPLALAQAASFILMNSLSIGEYVQLLDKSDSSFVRQLSTYFETVERDSDTPQALTATWMISFDQIEQRHPLASKIISLISILDRQAIPGEFVRNYCFRQRRENLDRKGSEEATVASGTLQTFSFISQAAQDTYDMHRLVHLVTHKWLLRKEMMVDFAREALMTVARSYPYGEHENQELCLKYLPHALAVLGRSGVGSKKEHAASAHLEHNVAAYFVYRRQYTDAEQHQKRAPDLQSAVHGQEHAKTFHRVNLLVRIYQRQNRLVEAEKLLLSTLEMEKRLLGEDANITLASTHHLLAHVYLKQERLEEAERLYLKILEIDKRVLDATHPDMLITVDSLAGVYKVKGQLEQAESLYLQTLDIARDLFGKEHPSTLTGTHNLSLVYQKQGRLDEAEELLLEVTQVERKRLGEDSPDTLNSMAELATIYEKKGQWEQAGQLYLQVLEKRRRTLGREHPDTLDSLYELTHVYRHRGRVSEAVELYTRLVELRRQVSGETHRETLCVESTVARLWWGQGRQKDAIQLMRRCIRSRRSILGYDHPRTVSSLKALSLWKQD
ncbi:hypothetical protein LZ30DRAFT_575431, partial [Colletotrichum cereale]